MELIIGQFRYVLASFLWGIFLMFLYDFIVVHRGTKKSGKSGCWLRTGFFGELRQSLFFK